MQRQINGKAIKNKQNESITQQKVKFIKVYKVCNSGKGFLCLQLQRKNIWRVLIAGNIVYLGSVGCLLDTRYKKLYLKSAFNFNISNISHQGYFTDKQSERLYKYKHITNHRKFGLISQKFT